MFVIGLSGKMGSGKDFIGKRIVYHFLKKYYPDLNVQFLAFADPLKMQVLNHYSSIFSYSDLYPPQNIPKTEQTRKILQFEGNLCREKDPDYWIKQYSYWAKLFKDNGCEVLITTDVRFRNEISYIVEGLGGMVCQVYSPNRTYQTRDTNLLKDKSECDLDQSSCDIYDYVFHNDQDIYSVEEAEVYYKEFFTLLRKRIEEFKSI
jgi:hypothetical protein